MELFEKVFLVLFVLNVRTVTNQDGEISWISVVAIVVTGLSFVMTGG